MHDETFDSSDAARLRQGPLDSTTHYTSNIIPKYFESRCKSPDMPEPFSIVTGVFGLVTGSLGLLLTSIEKLVQTTNKLKECKEQITQLHIHLRFCQRKLDDWLLRWSDNGSCFPESTYIWVWGTEGWSLLQERIDQIVKEIGRAQRILLPEASGNSEERNWKRAVKHAAAGRPPVGQRHLHIGSKIAFAVYRSTELSEIVSNIKSLVGDIEEDSKLMEAEVVRKHGNGAPFERTETVQNFVRRARPLWCDLREAHAALCLESNALAMLFQPPSTTELWAADEDQPLQIDLICTDGHFLAVSECYWISTFYQFQQQQKSDLTTGIKFELSRMETGGEKVTLQDTLKSVFRNALKLSPENRRRFEKSTDFARLRAAVAIATWVIYAWPTAWVDRMCSCGIRYAVLVDADKFPVFQKVTCHEDEECPGHRFPPSEFGKFMLLGTLLTEIALARPIQVYRNNELGWEFGIHDSNGMITNRSAHVDTNDLLRLLGGLPRSLQPFRSAVAHCFNSRNPGLVHDEICAEDIDAYMRCVVNP